MGKSLLTLIFFSIASASFAEVVRLEFAQSSAHNRPTQYTALSEADFTKQQSFWIKVIIESVNDRQAVVKAGNWYMQNVSFYDEQKILGTGNYVTVHLKAGINVLYLFYVFKDDKDKNNISITVTSLLAFNEEVTNMKVWQFSFASIVGLLFLLSIAYSLIIRNADRIYTHYALYLCTILIFFTYQYGILGNAIPVVQQIPPTFFWIFSDFITITYLYFSQSFLNMQKSYPYLHRLFDFGKYLVFSMLILEIISYIIGIDLLHSIWFKGPIFLFEVIVFPIIFYRIYQQKTMLSWLFLISAFILGLANLAGQMASTFKVVSLTNYFIQGALLIDAFLFSIGIGIRFGINIREKSKIQNDLIRQLKINEKVQEQNASVLELKVKERTLALDKRNYENEILIKEIHHRVKNNLQIVTSLLNLSEKKIRHEEAKKYFRESANRINAMGLIHGLLYQHEDYANIHLEKYVNELSQMLLKSFHSSYPKSLAKLNITLLSIDMNRAIDVGLIINELVTNSFKHGHFKKTHPIIEINLHQIETVLKLTVKDNGALLAKNTIHEDASFGIRMVESLAKKWDGSVTITSHEGFEVAVSLSLASVYQT